MGGSRKHGNTQQKEEAGKSSAMMVLLELGIGMPISIPFRFMVMWKARDKRERQRKKERRYFCITSLVVVLCFLVFRPF